MVEAICSICGKNKEIKVGLKKNKPICNSCYNNNIKPKRKCRDCGEIKTVAKKINDEPICHKCYKNYRPQKMCSVCGEIRQISKNNGDICICRSCYQKTEQPKRKCSGCGKIKRIVINIDEKSFCNKCYIKNFAKKMECVCCGKIEPVHKYIDCSPVCFKCYDKKYRPKQECFRCHKMKPVHKISDNKNFCKDCYGQLRKENNENIRLVYLLRERIRKAFINYSTIGKIKKSKEYGIDYEAIIKHLGSCPGDRKDYHIDHIFPISAFNFDDNVQILIAFSPENHQWLKKEENLSKNNNYNFDEFVKFCGLIINKYNLQVIQ